MFINLWGGNDIKMLHALSAKGASRHARVNDLTSIFSKFSGGDPLTPTSGRGTPLLHAPPLGTSCLALRVIYQALATPLVRVIIYAIKSGQTLSLNAATFQLGHKYPHKYST
jgi:hypothetical protein